MTFLIWSAPPSYAKDEVVCPTSVASIEGNQFSVRIIPILSQLYERIGCSLNLTPLPGRRGIHYFNTEKVDGELARFDVVEEKYKRPFVRSEVPMFLVTGSLWRHPDHVNDTDAKIGYSLGVVWQEEFAKTHKTQMFETTADLLQAYNSGAITALLAVDVALGWIEEGGLTPPPVRMEVVREFTSYHYLAEEFAPFMTLVSEELKNNDLFKAFKNK